ncbi:Vps5-domain-containing protein [Russula earlei]|uniref:Vps5-domain-containing protein n=1 Tax=Russula earlei TaxID=71964 RepID=A0ACC0U0X1_9AGAM|nr:Vps5-domain-containing protein [Russula earlei]
MSGFDDLLQQSSRALEENPFEDPFARPRSGSPDPLVKLYPPVCYRAASPTFEYGTSGFGGMFNTTQPIQAHDNTLGPSATESHVYIASAVPSDPLDSANLPMDDEPELTIKPLTEGVVTGPLPPPSPSLLEAVSNPPRTASPARPSITSPPASSPAVDPSSPVTPSFMVPEEPVEDTGPPSPPAPSSARLPQRQETLHPSTHLTFDSSSLTISDPHRITSTPLDQPPVTAFSSLALGGESFNVWDGAQSVFVNNTSIPTVAQEEDDDDDDKPLRPLPPMPLTGVAASDGPPEKKETGLQPVFTITVEDPQKVGDPIRAFTMYTVHTKTTSPTFSKPSFSVLRGYSDFLWLYETLSINNPGVIVPPRRFALENCINKIANHPVLCKDADLKFFLESDTFSLDFWLIKHRKAELASERGGLMASIGQSITGPRFVETDEWFDRQRAYLEVLESQLRGLVKAIEVVTRHRSDIHPGEFAQTVSDLAASDPGKSISHSLEELAELERKAQQIESAQMCADQATLLSTADEYARLVNFVRMAFSSRVRVYHAWQHADAELRQLKNAHERNRVQGKIVTDRLGQSYSQIGEAERRVLEAKHGFEHVSRLVKSEVARFEQERIEDFKKGLESLLDGMITRQKETIQAREAFQQLLLKKIPGSKGATLTSAV